MSQSKRMSRRQFIKGAALGAGAAILSACGGEAPATGNATSAAPAAPAATNAPAAATSAPAATTAATSAELTHWDWYVTQGPTIDEEIKLFQQANPGITVKKVTNMVDQYPDLFALAFKGGDAPDVFMIPNKPTFQEIAGNGWLADLKQFPDYADFAKTFPNPDQNFVEGVNVIGGKTYSAPFSSPNDAMWLQLWVNTKVFKDAGLVDAQGNAKLPETAEDMIAAARTIKEKSGGKVYGYGFGGTTDTPAWIFWMAQLSGADMGAPVSGGLDYRTGKFNFSSNPAYKGAIDTLTRLRDEGLIIPDSASVDDEAIRVLFAQHKFGMLLAGTWVMNGWKKTNPEFKEYTLTHVPLIDTNQPKSYFYASPGGSLYGLNPQSKNSEAAWKWYKWLYSKEAGDRWVKSGNGLSIHPEANKPEYAENDALKQYFALSGKNVRIAPQPGLRNPDTAKVKPANVKPAEPDIIKGIFTGQITDVAQALKDLESAKQAAFEQAIADAKAAGAKVSVEDYIFADWDPTKDYVTKKA